MSHQHAAPRPSSASALRRCREQSEEAVLQAGARYLTAALGATGCVVSRLVDDGSLRNVAAYSPPPWELGDEFVYLVSDFPLTIPFLFSTTLPLRSSAISRGEVNR